MYPKAPGVGKKQPLKYINQRKIKFRSSTRQGNF